MASEDYVNVDEGEIKPLMVSVTAPASLPAGYTFEALLNDDPSRPFLCEVPEGGVEEGQRFLAPLPINVQEDRINAPTGRWKDGLFDCFKPGYCHASWCCAFFCSKISMAQIMTRMSLTWLGEPGQRVATNNTFKVVVLLLVSYMIYSISLEVASLEYGPRNTPTLIVVLKLVGSFLFGVWSLYSLCRTRQSVRQQYSIPEEHCHGCEDLCCAFFCTCCTLSQMARHTGEYETYPAVCCSTTGHPPGTPLTV
ncbi:PLAC8 family domain containing protein [Nitzschia inconspicua]|uniref:PLAC8 family domain containing protein n=1 Tax=Nitzschia inconspicua TaxID=303405 RepID=A0A9K3Q031_9STRA|nr:PLAC8 family domain containing protein [Nitzschia inconspicua]